MHSICGRGADMEKGKARIEQGNPPHSSLGGVGTVADTNVVYIDGHE